MEPIEEYLRNLHKKNSPHSQSREHTEHEAQAVREDAANAPTTELPTVVAALRNNEAQNTLQKSGRTQSSPTRASRRSKRTRKRPRRYDLMIVGAC